MVSRLRPRLLGAHVEQRRKDGALRARIERLHFLRPAHLDIPQRNQHPEVRRRGARARSESTTRSCEFRG